ncbi:MAG TPA: hypothetical protein VGI60_08060 [Chthoniobacterales bacterium]|jgi:hypothetical protein
MRSICVVVSLTIFVGAVRAQEQEHKLIDRLLRPDMSLVNSAQEKKFVAADGTPFDKKFDAKVFYTGEQHSTKSFLGIREFFARKFGTKKSSQSELVAVTQGESRYAGTQFATRKSSFADTAHDAEKTIKGGEYAEGDRPFLAKGTRQKILSQQDHPLTIDEVRELLNRNE